MDRRALETEALLAEISSYCRETKVAETTFGRLAVNDGKFVSRLRNGSRITSDTVMRVRSFMAGHGATRQNEAHSLPALAEQASRPAAPSDTGRNFRFFDNRQKYLLFVTTCSEKWVVAERVIMELENIHPSPPAVRIFDAGVGDGTVLTRVMRAMHRRFPEFPFYVVGKEISLEDVRLALEKVPDRFSEHPATMLIMTNMYYAEAPLLTPNSVEAASCMVWKEFSLAGDTARDFERQITELQPFLSEHWTARVSPKTGNPVYDKPVVLVIYREDCKFLLDHIRPRRGSTHGDYDLVIASQPYRARASTEFKARRVIAPLSRALRPGGRLIGVHSYGHDPGAEIVQRIWPGENPFQMDRHELLRAVKTELGRDAKGLNFNAYSDDRSLFRYDLHTLPNEISASIGTSTLLAAWNAVIYVNQIEDHKLHEVMGNERYLETTRDVLQQYGGLWFWDESYCVSRRSDA
jgi:SAM-dependent methyltransferase